MSPAPSGNGVGLAFRLMRRELRGGLRGFVIFLACLTLGVGAIAAVGSVSSSMLSGLQADGRKLLGGDLDMRLGYRPASEEERAFLETQGDLSVSTHTRAMARSTGESGRRSLVELRGVDDLYPLYGQVKLDPPLPLEEVLEERDGIWGAAADATLLARLDAKVGDLVELGATSYQLRAVLVQEPDRTAQALILGPGFMVSSDSVPATGLVQPGSLVHYHYRLRVPEGQSVTAVRQEIETTFPEAGWRIRDSVQAAPGVTRFIERLGLFLTLVGLTSLLVGGVGVANAARGYLEGKTETIATLKCLGAPSRLIFQLYLMQVLVIAGLGIVLGLAIGALAPLAVAALLSDQLGWSAEIALYPAPLALAALFGVLITLTFTLWPLARARAVSGGQLFRALVAPPHGGIGRPFWLALGVLAAFLAGLTIVTAADRWLAAWFVFGAACALVLFALAGRLVQALARRVPRLKHPGLRLAVANLHRPGAPTNSVVLSLGLGLTVLIAIAQVEGNLGNQLKGDLADEAPFAYFIDIQPDQVAAFEETIAAQPGVEEMKRVPMLRGRISAVRGTPVSELTIPDEIDWVFRGDRGLTWTREPIEGTELVLGDWWPADYDGEPLVSLDAEVGELLGLELGDRLSINILGRDIEVTIANLRVIDWTTMGINFVMVFSPGLLESAPQTHIATVRAAPGAEDAIERAVIDSFANVSSIRVRQALEAVAQLVGQIANALRATAGVALLSGVLVLAGAIAAGHRRRVYDAVVLKVLGATRGDLGRAFLMEYGLLGLVSAIIAGVVGTIAAYVIVTEVMDMPFDFLPEALVATALLAVSTTLILGFAGTWRALTQKAMPHLRND
ncbi:MAG: FtsX-like permease family protein [Pseudomonadota bacterium]